MFPEGSVPWRVAQWIREHSGRPAPTRRAPTHVGNVADGGVIYWLARLYLFGLAVVFAVLLLGGVTLYASIAAHTPDAPDLYLYAQKSPGVTRIVATDGTLLGEYARERREFVPYDQIPQRLREAFLAAEDHRFFFHGGIDLKGILRAAWHNLTVGEWVQGGSTIEQQLAKQFLGAQKTLLRKAREAVLARRIERRYSKEEILTVYLNQIYLGSGAFGVKAAAQRYFGKTLDDLSLAEMALLAGLAQAPSNDSPLRSPEAARQRRDHVLDKMARYGVATSAEAVAAKGEPITIGEARDTTMNTSPYFLEHVRRELVRELGQDVLLERGLVVETTVLPWVDGVAQENVDFLARKQDKRQGWRGPEAHLGGTARRTFEERASALYGDRPLEPGRQYLASVKDVTRSSARVLVGKRGYEIPLRQMSWAFPWSATDALNDLWIEDARDALRPGDVVWVSTPPVRKNGFSDWAYDTKFNVHWLGSTDSPGAGTRADADAPSRPSNGLADPGRRGAGAASSDRRATRAGNAAHRSPATSSHANRTSRSGSRRAEAARSRSRPDVVRLEQIPHPQAALFTFDHETGYVLAMVGGQDYARSEYNRIVQGSGKTRQACRQPGSTYKPIYYSAALDQGFSFDTVLNDKPHAEVDPVTGEIWVPTNLHGTVDYEVTLEYALVFSKNIPSVDLLVKVGAENAKAWARRLGFTSPIIADKALALGASCTYMDELSRAFAIFARNGRWLDLKYVRRVLDRQGRVLRDNTTYYDEWLSPSERLDRLIATAGQRDRQAIPARAAYLTTRLLREVITHGYSAPVRRTHIAVAGKTGTSSATMDVWFVAFSSRWLTSAWMGDDERVRPLGKHDAAYMTVVPLWARYMNEATEGLVQGDLPAAVPAGVSPRDRGEHRRGKIAEAPMPLVPPTKVRSDETPDGMGVRERKLRPVRETPNGS